MSEEKVKIKAKRLLFFLVVDNFHFHMSEDFIENFYILPVFLSAEVGSFFKDVFLGRFFDKIKKVNKNISLVAKGQKRPGGGSRVFPKCFLQFLSWQDAELRTFCELVYTFWTCQPVIQVWTYVTSTSCSFLPTPPPPSCRTIQIGMAFLYDSWLKQTL